MADDIPDDLEGFDSGMLEWFYVEDDYPLAVSVLSVVQLLQRSGPNHLEPVSHASWMAL